MEWQATWEDPFTRYLSPFHDLIGDARTRTTLTETVQGMIGAGSLVCQRSAAHAPILAAVQDGAQRILRMVTGGSTKRSPDLDADHLTATLRRQAVDHLGGAPADELWLIADGSELRKPHARAMPHLMRVRSLDGGTDRGRPRPFLMEGSRYKATGSRLALRKHRHRALRITASAGGRRVSGTGWAGVR